jgi:predicted RNase H-like nuclease (RuvC/YqgF family)
MSKSAPPDPAAVEQEIAALEAGVGRLIEELQDLRARAERAETEHRQLEDVLIKSRVDTEDPRSLQNRLRDLTEENSRLRETIREARTRAERIRSRLIVMEDESST